MVPDDCLLRTMASSTTTSSGSATKMDAAPLPLGDEEEEGGGAPPPQDHDSQNSKEPHRSQSSPDDNNSDIAQANSLVAGQVDSLDSQSASPNNVLLRIPLSKPDTNSGNPDESKCVIVQNGPDKPSEHKQEDSEVVRDNTVLSVKDKEDAATTVAVTPRRASYIDVVGLSGDELPTAGPSVSAAANGTVSPATVASATTDRPTNTAVDPSVAATLPPGVFSAEDTEDKDLSEDEDKLVIHEGGADRRAEEEDDEVIALVKQEDNNEGEVKMDSAKEDVKEGSAGEDVKGGGVREDIKVHKEEDLGRGSNKRPSDQVDFSEQPKKKVRCSAVGATAASDGEKEDSVTLEAASSASQAELVLAQVNRELQMLEQQLRQKEQEWDELLRAKLSKQALAERLRRKTQVLRLQGGEEEEESIPTGGLLAALTRGNNAQDTDNVSPLQMMSRLLSSSTRAQTTTDQSSSRSNASSPSVSIIDIHTRTSSPALNLSSSGGPDSSLATSHSSNRYGSVAGLSDPLKSKLSRQLMAGKPILPKPQSGSSPATLAGMLASNGSAVPATGYGPQGPTISVQQLIAAHRKDNPSAPPVNSGLALPAPLSFRGAKRGAWRQKYDGGKRGGRGDSGAAGLTHLDPNLSYNDMLLQFAQLTQQHASDKTGPGSPQISIIPVSDSSGGGSPYSVSSPHPPNSALTLSGGLSVTPAPSTKHNAPSPILEGTSALAKLLMESRAGSKQSAMLQQQQQQLQQAAAGAGVTNSHYLTLSALLSGGSTTTVREKANAMAAAVAAQQVAAQQAAAQQAAAQQANNAREDEKKTTSAAPADVVNNNPKCQGCHKSRAQFVCAGCGNQWYCSRTCQVAAWDEHSVRCNT